MQISHFREKPEFLHLGTIGTLSASTLADDLVRMRVQLSAPAHCYLIALHPNGETQLYYPESETQPPPLVSEFVYPPDDQYSPLTDGVGLQAYVLIASRAPLPAFREWKKPARKIPWLATKEKLDGVWLFDGLAFHWVKSGMRSQPRALQKTPTAFETACRYLEQAFDGDVAIQAWAFPVVSNNPARAASQ
jgi:hypothetical protein